MKATSPPRATRVSNKDLAAMLGLSSPEGAGARRVAKAFGDLAGLKLVERTRDPGRVPTTLVLNPIGDGTEWSDVALKSRFYITLPPDLWRRGWFITLSGRAIALLIILRELTNARAVQGTYVDPIRWRQFGLSEDTWTRATKQLQEVGLLTVRNDVYSFQGEPRRRNVYTLHLDRLQDDPRDTVNPSILGGDPCVPVSLWSPDQER